MSVSRSGRFALIATILALAVPAQLQFEELGGGRLSNQASTSGIATGDIDGDGDRDLVLGGRLFVNNGRGAFTDVTATQLPGNDGGRVELADLDGDGDLDIVYATGLLFINNGAGTFADVTAGRLPAVRGQDAAALDVDGDGDADLVFAIRNEPNTLFLNDGTGSFVDVTAQRMPSIAVNSTAVAAGDLDGDGDPDLIFTSSDYEPHNLYRNDGGVFRDVTAHQLPSIGGVEEQDVALGDLDGDGDLDIAFAGAGEVSGTLAYANRLAFNDGRGFFTQRNVTGGTSRGSTARTHAVAIGDVDGDGDNDLLYGNVCCGYCLYCYQGRVNQLMINDGSGNFREQILIPNEDKDTFAVALEDLDGDGDLDAVIGNAAYESGTPVDKLYLNLLRQLDAPYPAQLGAHYLLAVYARYGRATNGDLAYPLLAPATANIPLPPLGTLFLEPSTMVPLAPLAIPQPSGVSSLSLVVPAVPSLVGVTLYAQALLIQHPSAFFTNSTEDEILR